MSEKSYQDFFLLWQKGQRGFLSSGPPLAPSRDNDRSGSSGLCPDSKKEKELAEKDL